MSWLAALFGRDSDEQVYELYGEPDGDDVVLVVDPYAYEMFSAVQWVYLCHVCYCCRSADA